MQDLSEVGDSESEWRSGATSNGYKKSCSHTTRRPACSAKDEAILGSFSARTVLSVLLGHRQR